MKTDMVVQYKKRQNRGGTEGLGTRSSDTTDDITYCMKVNILRSVLLFLSRDGNFVEEGSGGPESYNRERDHRNPLPSQLLKISSELNVQPN